LHPRILRDAMAEKRFLSEEKDFIGELIPKLPQASEAF